MGQNTKTFFRDNSGVVAVLVAIALPILLAAVALGVEVTGWYAKTRQLQSAADAAAIAAAYEYSTGYEDYMDTSAENEAARNGFNSDIGTLTLNTPPEDGDYSGNNDAVEVYLSEPYDLSFMLLFLDEPPNIVVRAVAAAEPKVSDDVACVLSLDSSACGAINVSGNGDVEMDGCVVAANSDCDSALSISGSGDLLVTSASLVGGYEESGSGSFTFSSAPKTSVPSTPDPYEDIEVPAYGGCDHNNKSLNGNSSSVLSPGVYCGGLAINEKGPTTLLSGVYIIVDGNLRVNAQADVVGVGVTFILTSSDGSSYPNLTVNGGATMALTAPTSGTYSGILFYGDRDSDEDMDVRFNGTSTMDLDGALYFPSDNIKFSGNNSSGSSCTQLISKTVTFTGSSDLAHDCSGNGTTDINPFEPGGVSLVE